MNNRIFTSSDFIVPSNEEPIRSVVTSSDDSTIIMWTVKPGQVIKPHIHPEGQDTWYVLSGSAEYISDDTDKRTSIQKGDFVIAYKGEIHGAVNNGDEPFTFISVVSPSNAGFQLK